MPRPTHISGHESLRPPSPRLPGLVLTAMGLLVIAAVTLSPQPAGDTSNNDFWCFGCGEFGSVDLLLNVVLFVPLGVGLWMFRRSWRRALLLVVATTALVECLQWMGIPGRDASFADLVTNTLGGLLGIWLGMRWRAVVDPGPRLARRLAVSGAVGWCLLRVATGVLFAPSFPATDWYGQLAPEAVYPADFRGRLDAATVAGRALVPGVLPDAAGWLAHEPRSVVAQLVTAGPTPALASVVSILDAGQTEILVLGQEGDDARFRIRLRAADARLRVPSLRLPAAFKLPPGTALRVTGMLRNRGLELAAASSLTEIAARLPLDAGLTWALLLPADQGLGPSAVWVTATCTAVILLMVGFWCGRSAGPTGLSLFLIASGGVAVLVAGLLGPPLITPVAPADRVEWLFALSGLCVGLWCGTDRRRGKAGRVGNPD